MNLFCEVMGTDCTNGGVTSGRNPGMFGGHFVHTSDSRFPFESPIPVFDRYESPELSRYLSR